MRGTAATFFPEKADEKDGEGGEGEGDGDDGNDQPGGWAQGEAKNGWGIEVVDEGEGPAEGFALVTDLVGVGLAGGDWQVDDVVKFGVIEEGLVAFFGGRGRVFERE